MVEPYRLPPHVRPRHYDVHLHARVGEAGFHGVVRIALDLREPVDRVELHAAELHLGEATLHVDGRELAARAEARPEAEMVALRLPERVGPGEAELVVPFSGKVSRNMEGLYLSKDGPEECLATQCEETDARRIFPCFDEPAFKARFSVKVTTSPDATVLANAPLAGVEQQTDGQRTWTFAPTQPMSSYLFALAVGRLASTPERFVEGVPMRVWAMEGKERLGGYGQDFAARLLPWFNDYFGVPYHFDKYDQVAVPSFSAGAMENSGLVIFRKEYLLHDPAATSIRQEKLIARVIAHEFAHMWFGNLVTMAWWDDIWLNESFAEWMAHKAVDAVAPEYRIWDDFQAGKATAFESDALASTHSIYSPVETPEQATELFDAITYEKGSGVMRMLETFLGEEAFRAGLRTYMKEFSERNAAGDDLWRHLERASSRPVTSIMRSWITQPGHPVVSLSYEGGRLRASQRRFFAMPGAVAPGQRWEVPLVLRYRDDAGVHELRHLLSDAEGEVPLRPQGELRWIHANADAIGFYRQAYDKGLRDRLVRHLDELTAAEQAGLVDDQWALVRAAQAGVGGFLPVLGAVLARPKGFSVLDRAVAQLKEVEELLALEGDARALDGFRAWVARALRPQAERLGWAPREGEGAEDAQMRATLLHALAVYAEDPEAVRTAVALAEEEAQAPARVDANLAGPAVAIAARFGDAARLERHLRLYEARRAAGASPQETQRYLNSLAMFREPALVARVLETLGSGRLPLEAVGPLLRQMLRERHSRELAWEHLRARWKDVRSGLGDMWTGFLVEQTGYLPASRREEMARFYDAHLDGVAQQAYARALEKVDQREEFRRRATPDLAAWFRGQDA